MLSPQKPEAPPIRTVFAIRGASLFSGFVIA